MTTDEARWAAVCARDAAQDGAFVYGVHTTGVYCRPSCASRRARRENVVFFDGTPAAESAGFRPCKRCRPEIDGDPRARERAALVARVCALIERSETVATMATLAEAVGRSSGFVSRTFKAEMGVTPRAWAAAARAQRMREALRTQDRVTDAIYDAGYPSAGRFYEGADAVLGMEPSRFQRGGEGATVAFAFGDASLGRVLVAGTERGVCAVLLGEDDDALMAQLRKAFPKAHIAPAQAAVSDALAEVVALVDAPARSTLPLDLQGTAFQVRVWTALTRIPAGAQVSYGELAASIGSPKAVRAVASACAANKVAVLVPCHRVVRRDGSLSGYRWGVDRKRRLLEREQVPSLPPR